MENHADDRVPRIDASLDPIRAAIQLVADGVALRITVHTPHAAQVLPAARQLARASGVAAELVRADADNARVAITRISAVGA